MNYIKQFYEPASSIETVVNAWFKEVDGKGHRVLHSRAFTDGTGFKHTWIRMIFTVNDEPNPHKKK